MMLRLRRVHEAHRDAGLVFRAASEGRPLELQRRLVLGKLAGGATITRISPSGSRITPVEAATAGGHYDCVELLAEAMVDVEKIYSANQIEQSGRLKATPTWMPADGCIV